MRVLFLFKREDYSMASVCILDEFEVHKNEKFLRIAEAVSYTHLTLPTT